MSTLLNVSENKIESNVHEYRLDEISAIYNLLSDAHISSKRHWVEIDHTSQGIKPSGAANETGNHGTIQNGDEKRSEGSKTGKLTKKKIK